MANVAAGVNAAAAVDAAARRRAWWALAVLTTTYVLSFVDRQILSLLVEPMRRDLAITDFQASLLQGLAFAVIYAVSGLPLAAIADRFSRRNLIVAGVLVWSSMTAFCGLARQYWSLFIGRAGVGIGEAALSPAAYSMLTDYFKPRELPRAMAIYNIGNSIGAGLSYLLGGVVLAMVGTQAAVSLGPLGEVRPWQLTFIAIGALGLPVALLLLSIREPARQALTTPGAQAPAHGAAVGAASEFSLTDCLKYLWRRRASLGALFLAMSALGIGSYATMAWYPTMFVRSFGLELSGVGLRFGAIYVLASLAGNLLGGWGATWCGDRGCRQPYVTWMLSMSVLLVVTSCFTPLLPSASGRYAASAALIVLQSTWMAAGVATMHLMAPIRMRAQLTAVLLFGTNVLGLIVGPTGVASLTQWYFGRDAALNFSLAIVCTAACLIGASLLVVSRRAFERPDVGASG